MGKFSKIAVFYGSDSSEWEVSCRSGEFVASRIDGTEYDVYEIFARFGKWQLVAMKKHDAMRIPFPEGSRPEVDKTDFSVKVYGEKVKFDYAYIVQHGTPGENGLLQGYLEMLGIPFSSCSAFVSAVAFDKFACKSYIRETDFVKCAPDVFVRNGMDLDKVSEKIAATLKFRVFVKPTDGGSSFGITKVSRPEDVKEAIRDCIEAKNYPALGDMLDALPQSDTTKALRMLPRLFGGEEVFEKAAALCKGQHFASILDELHSLWKSVAQFAGKERVTVDLGMMHRTDYYTGMILRGYLSGYGEEILSGGRYDKLIAEFGYDVPATGFAVNIDAVVKVLSKQQSGAQENQQRSNVLIWAAEGCEADAVEAATNLRKKGLIVEHSLSETLEGAQKYAAEHGIDSVLPIEVSKAAIQAERGADQ